MVGTKRTEAFEGVINLVPEIVSSDADVAPWDGRYLGERAAAGELVFHVFGAIAQFERRLIAKRTRDGVAVRAEGRHPGRPKLDQEKLRAALTLICNGMSPTKAARHVGLGRSTLYRELALIPGALPKVA